MTDATHGNNIIQKEGSGLKANDDVKNYGDKDGFGDKDDNAIADDANNNNRLRGDGDGRYELKLKIVKQESTWDCGLACTKMVLGGYGANYGNLDTICSALEVNTSVWSIDLSYILKHYNIGHIFFTTTVGVDKSYSKEPFYKEYFNDDVERVERLFNQAKSVGLKIEKKSVSMGEIVRHLRSLRPIIILVDWPIIKTQHSPLSSCFKPFFKRVGKYQGHFIVLTGCTEDGRKIFYLNPEKSSRKSVNALTLDDARKSYGTDQDIIFITEKLNKTSHGDR